MTHDDTRFKMADQPTDINPQLNEIEKEAQTEPDVNKAATNTKRCRKKSRPYMRM